MDDALKSDLLAAGFICLFVLLTFLVYKTLRVACFGSFPGDLNDEECEQIDKLEQQIEELDAQAEKLDLEHDQISMKRDNINSEIDKIKAAAYKRKKNG